MVVAIRPAQVGYMLKPDPLAPPAADVASERHRFFRARRIGLNARRKLAISAPLAVEAVERIDVIFDHECMINTTGAEERPALRQANAAERALRRSRSRP